MVKAWAKLSVVTKLSLFLFVGGLIYALMPESTAPATPKPKPTATRRDTSSNMEYTDADRKASFALLSEPLKDSFKPLVIRTNIAGEGNLGRANAIPAYMASGDGNWIYTGTAEIDGVPTALLENSSTGEGVFLKHGERWKDLIVQAINPDSIAVRGTESGEDLTLRLASPTTEEDLRPANPASALEGAIGNMSVTPSGIPGLAPAASRAAGGAVERPAPPARAGG